MPEEIVCFKKASRGRPVFWIHAAAGGNSIGQYQQLANVSQRTFYAIKPPRIDIKCYWLLGIEARASYYIALIKSIDPVGPYDLGGYSMGSTLAYEIARQLMAVGDKVQSLVLIDPTDMEYVQRWAQALNQDDLGAQSLLLRTMNFALLADGWADGRDSVASLIHRHRLLTSEPMDLFVESLFQLGHQRGLTLAKDQFMLRVIQDQQLLESLICYGYKRSLPANSELDGYLFYNRSQLMQGSCAPYILVDDSLSQAVEENYNTEWLEKCRHFKKIELDCTTHFMFLFESELLKPCVELCRMLYVLND